MKKALIFLCILGYIEVASSQIQNSILYFDVNKTILMEDKASGKTEDQIILGLLAEKHKSFFIDWSGSGKIESFYHYISRKLSSKHHGKNFKKKRDQTLNSDFLPELVRRDPGLFAKAKALKLQLKNILGTAKPHRGLIPSFAKFLKTWDRWCHDSHSSCKLVIRTFGEDIDLVVDGMKQILDEGIKIEYGSINGQGQLQIGKTSHPMANISQAILKSSADYIFIRDHYDRWKNGRFKSQFGKPFPVGSNNLSIFFDDNVEGATEINEKDIIFRFDEQGNFLSPRKVVEQGLLVPVTPIQAILDEDYFSSRVKSLLNDF